MEQHGLHSEKGPTWGQMGRSFIRAALNSARNVNPQDSSPQAAAARRIEGFHELDGLEFLARVDIDKDARGQERNVVKFAVEFDRPEYAKLRSLFAPSSAGLRPAAPSATASPQQHAKATGKPHGDHRREAIRSALIARLDTLLAALFPAGKERHGKIYIGNILGSPGDSLEIVLEGEKAGLWTDRAHGDGGDLFALIAGHFGLDAHTGFAEVLDRAQELLGRAPTLPVRKAPAKKETPVDDLGPATAKWNYLDAQGQLIAVVYRHDPPGRKKEFRPWDVKRRKMAPPNPRPLYNQPGLVSADLVVLTEGEKCAQALIDAGVAATTAMHGANAPVDKTDWSPLAGKAVLIWPDKDKPGWDYAERAAEALLEAGARSAAILMVPENKPQGWDAADAIQEGFDVTGLLAAGPRVPVTAPVMEETQDDPLLGVDWYTEDGLAAAFTHRHGADWRYCAKWGKWLVWTGTRWNADDMLYVLHLARGICRAASQQAKTPRLTAKLASSSTFSAIEKIARSDPQHAASVDEWDADPWLLTTPTGVVDLRTGQMRPHDRADRMTKQTTATLTAGARCPHWLQFLDQATGGDVELMGYLQRVFGYCLTGSTQEHALFFLYGTGANGKSVFVNTLFTIMGDYAANAPMDTFMETRGDRHPTDLAGLRGARFVAATETEQGRRWNESKIKEITGGDRVSARFMRQDFFTYVPQFKLMIAGNHKPAIRNIDEAMRRRLHLVPFTLTVPPERRDKHLQAKLLTERHAIFEWGVHGCLEWQRHGLQSPQSVRAATDEYFESEDSLGRWMGERCVRTANAKALTTELFNDWKQWAEGVGEFVGSQRRFSDLLLNRGIDRWRNTVGVRGYQGIGLKEPPRPAYTAYADH